MLRLLLAAMLLMFPASVAQAAVCTVHVGDLEFATIDTLGGSAASTNTDISISCDGIGPGTDTITLCGNIGAGSGGASGGLRQSTAGTDTLSFALYASAGTSTPWGSMSTPELGDPYRIALPVSGDSASATAHLYAVVPAGQSGTPTGDYTASFGSSDVDFKYAEGDLDCSSPVGAADAPASFIMHANVSANCLLQTHDLDFGTAGIIGSNIDAATTLDVTCTPGTGYSISIDGGSSGDPDHRLLHDGTKTVGYGLFADAQHTDVWGADTVSDEGTGATQHAPVYGRVPPQAAAPGSYTDTVVVTIAY